MNPAAVAAMLEEGIDMSAEIPKIRTDEAVRVRGTLGMRAAEGVTGGVNLREIDPRTFQSRLSPGLYVVGQLLDISADWGGFEQHFALASGFVAGATISLDREARPR